MAAGVLVVPSLFPARDRNGRLVAGALMAVFANRTTTLTTVYSDSALTTPLANPVVANSSGVFPIIWAEAGTVEDPSLYTVAISGPGGTSIANPSVFHDWQPSLDADTAAMVLAAGSAATSVAAAAEAEAYLAAIEDAIAGAPLPPYIPFVVGPPIPVAGSTFAADWVVNVGDSNPLLRGGLWPGVARVGYLFGKSYVAGDEGATEGPLAGIYSHVRVSGTGINGAGVGVMADAVAYLSGDVAFGFNGFASAGPGALLVKLVGNELDLLFGFGSTPSGAGGGEFINNFYGVNAGAVLQTNSFGPGACWSNGIKLGQINSTTGAGLSMGDMSDFIASLVNSTVGGFTQAALELGHGTGPGLRLHGPVGDGSDAARIFNSNGFLVLRKGPQALVVQNQAGTSSVLAVDDNGAQAVGKNAALGSGATQHVAQFASTEGEIIAKHTNAAGVAAFSTYNATSGTMNAAASAFKAFANATTGRSGTVTGTLNAAGADYAEYERLCDAALTAAVLSGDVIGFGADGKITLVFSEAISFGVKSTHPNLVGGDQWHEIVGPPPERPVFETLPYDGPANPGDDIPILVTPEQAQAAMDAVEPAVAQLVVSIRAEGEERELAHEEIESRALAASERARLLFTSKAQMLADKVGKHEAYFEAWAAWWSAADAHEASEAARKAAFEAGPMADYEEEKAAFEERLNVERKKYDRIAYCGKVPVNVTGAKPGQYLIPAESDDGAITGRLVDPADMTVGDMLARLGRVRRVLDDGRAEIVVAVG